MSDVDTLLVVKVNYYIRQVNLVNGGDIVMR